jgi:hypothetical protein
MRSARSNVQPDVPGEVEVSTLQGDLGGVLVGNGEALQGKWWATFYGLVVQLSIHRRLAGLSEQ